MVVQTPDRRESREQQMRDAIHTATGLTLADRWVFDTLLWTADFGTARLPGRFQPRSLGELAKKAFVSGRQIKYSLDHLQRHGWLERFRNLTDKGIGGRGHPTRYVLQIGRSCDCKGGTDCTVPTEKQGSEYTGKGARPASVSAGQASVPAGRARGRESKEGKPEPDYPGGPVDWETGEPLETIRATGWDPGSYGAAENRES